MKVCHIVPRIQKKEKLDMDEAKDRFGDYLLGYNESEYFRGLFLYRGICGPKN
jgi:hypothetical protein